MNWMCPVRLALVWPFSCISFHQTANTLRTGKRGNNLLVVINQALCACLLISTRFSSIWLLLLLLLLLFYYLINACFPFKKGTCYQVIASERALVFLFLLFSRDNTHRCTLCPCHSTPFLSFSFFISLPCCSCFSILWPLLCALFPLSPIHRTVSTAVFTIYPHTNLPPLHTSCCELLVWEWTNGRFHEFTQFNSVQFTPFDLKHPTSHSAFIPPRCVYFHSWFWSNGLDFHLLSFLLPFSKQGRKKLFGRFRRSCCWYQSHHISFHFIYIYTWYAR